MCILCECVCESKYETDSTYVCVCMSKCVRERKELSVCVRECVCECMCVCVCVLSVCAHWRVSTERDSKICVCP